MKILALESSAKAASAALLDNNLVIGENFLHTGKTHSQTLLPATEQLLKNCDTTIADVDLFAVAAGPGSFTGLRIAIAAVKGMAMAQDKPCVGVSTLEALAYNLRGFEGTAAAVMDARCGQVYTALFDLHDGTVTRKSEDMAISIQNLQEMLLNIKNPIFLVGDGAKLCYNILLESLPNIKMAPPHLILQRASSVAQCALQQYEQHGAGTATELLPVYLRLPQAERQAADRKTK